jgi:hypothetical protein
VTTPTNRIASATVAIAALVAGFTVSVFTAGPALFADGSFSQRPPVLLVSICVFAVLGLGLGALVPAAWKLIATMLMIAAIPAVLFFGADVVGQVPMMVLAAGFALGDAAAGAFGAWMGARWRLRERRP